jgi:hypothetical protein
MQSRVRDDSVDNRISPRRRMLKQGKVVMSDWTVIDCVIRDLRDTGARLEFAGLTGLPRSSAFSSYRRTC